MPLVTPANLDYCDREAAAALERLKRARNADNPLAANAALAALNDALDLRSRLTRVQRRLDEHPTRSRVTS